MTSPVDTLAFHVVVVAYAVAATLFFIDLARVDRPAFRWAPHALLAAVVLHAVHLGLEVFATDLMASSLRFGLSLCAISVAGTYLVVRRRTRIHAIGVVVAPLSLTLLVGAEFLRKSGAPPQFPHTLLLMHIAANVLGMGLFLLAGAAGAFYLFQERRFKAKRVSSFPGKLPPLDALDLTEHRLLLAGFPLLTFGIVTGAVFAAQIEVTSGASLARSALGYATWLLVGGVLVLRAVAGWRGRRAAYGTLAGVLCVLVVIGIYVANSRGGGGL